MKCMAALKTFLKILAIAWTSAALADKHLEVKFGDQSNIEEIKLFSDTGSAKVSLPGFTLHDHAVLMADKRDCEANRCYEIRFRLRTRKAGLLLLPPSSLRDFNPVFEWSAGEIEKYSFLGCTAIWIEK